MSGCEKKQHTYKFPQPRWYKSKMGYDFELYADKWQLDGSKVVKFNLLYDFNIDFVTEVGFRKTLCRYAEEMSASMTVNIFYYFQKYLRDTEEKNINVTAVTNYLSTLDDETEYKLGALKGFFISWYDWGFEGVSKDTVDFLEELTLQGNVKGKAVKRACPYFGPLTHNELGALIEWVSTAFSQSDISLESYAYIMIIALTGRRGINVRMLRSKDLVSTQHKSYNAYIINFPRAKQRNATYRSQFSPLTIDEDIYLILSSQRNKSISSIELAIGEKLPEKLRGEVPIFLQISRLASIQTIADFEKVMARTPDFLHLTINSSQYVLRELSKKCMAKSERTGDFIHLTTRRFRYTKATNLVRRGIKGVALAAALDQSDTQNIGFYTENTEEIAKQISKTMAPVLAPLAQAFSGTLVASERDALRGNDPHSRIKNNNHNLGSCGTYSFCASGYRACYTCVNFQPWLEASHEEVLEEILQERERQEGVGVSSYVIQSTDRLLLAVQQVVDMCVKEKASRG